MSQGPHYKSHCLCRLFDTAPKHPYQQDISRSWGSLPRASQECAGRGQTSPAESTSDCATELVENSESLVSFPCWVRLGGDSGQERSWPGRCDTHGVMASRRKPLTQSPDYIKLRKDLEWKSSWEARSTCTHGVKLCWLPFHCKEVV